MHLLLLLYLAIHCGCEHTSISERKPYLPYSAGVWTPQYYSESERKSHVPYTVDVEWPIPFQEAVSFLYTPYTHTTLRLLWKKDRSRHTHNVHAGIVTKMPIWKPWVCGHSMKAWRQPMVTITTLLWKNEKKKEKKGGDSYNFAQRKLNWYKRWWQVQLGSEKTEWTQKAW